MSVPDRFAKRQYGTDTSGRKLFLYNDTKLRLDLIEADLGWLPTITQGEDMDNAGGGASASAGYHDGRGCVDFRTWDRTESQLNDFIRVASKYGVQGWRRDAAHGGMDPHIHVVCCGPTHGMASGAISQMHSVAREGDGLVPEGHDYERRHRRLPLVLDFDYAKHARQEDDDLNADDREWLAARFEAVNANVNRLEAGLNAFRENEVARDQDDAQRDAAVAAKVDRLVERVNNLAGKVNELTAGGDA